MKLRLGEEKLTEKNSLQTAIKMATQSWTQLHESGDPNTVDVYWHAGKVVELLGLRLPTELPLKETGVDSFTDSEYKAFMTLKTFKNDKLSDLEKAKAIAKLIDG